MAKICDEDKQSEEEFNIEDEVIPAPDGGIGWLIVAASLFTNLVIDGVCYSFGSFLDAIIHKYDTNSSTASLVGSLCSGVYLIMGPITATFANTFGCRPVAMFGGAIAFAGFVAASFATNIYQLIISWGIFGGIGFGLLYLPGIVIVGFWFEKKRALATGIAVSGSGIGSFSIAPLASFILEKTNRNIGFTLRVLSAIVLCTFGFAAMFKPLKKPSLMERMKQAKEERMNQGSMFSVDEYPSKLTSIPSEDEYEDDAAPPAITVDDYSSNVSLEKDVFEEKDSSDRPPQISFQIETGEKEDTKTRPSKTVRLSGHQDQHTRKRHKSQEYCNPKSPMDRRKQKFFSNVILYDGSVEEIWKDRSKASQINLTTVKREDLVDQINNKFLNRSTIFMSNSTFRIPGQQQAFMGSNWQTYASSNIYISRAALDGEKNKFMFNILDGLKKMLDFSLIKSLLFNILCVSAFLALSGLYIPYVFIPTLATNKLNTTVSEAASIISILGVSNTLGRIATGFISDFESIDVLWLTNLSLIFAGFATLLVPLCNSYWLLAAYASFFGLTMASFITLRSILLVDLLGIDRLTSAFGLLLMFQGLAAMIGTPMAGALYDFLQNYDSPFLVAAFLFILSGAICFPCRKIAAWESRGGNPFYKPKPMLQAQISTEDVQEEIQAIERETTI